MNIVPLLFSFEGRITRRTYFFTSLLWGLFMVGVLALIVVSFFANIGFWGKSPQGIVQAISGSIAGLLIFALLIILGAYVNVTLLKKRFNDTGQFGFLAFVPVGFSAASIVLLVVPILGAVLSLIVNVIGSIAALVVYLLALFVPPTRGDNDFGPDPRDPNGVAAKRNAQFDLDEGAMAAQNEALIAKYTAQTAAEPQQGTTMVGRYQRDPGQRLSSSGKPVFGRR